MKNNLKELLHNLKSRDVVSKEWLLSERKRLSSYLDMSPVRDVESYRPSKRSNQLINSPLLSNLIIKFKTHMIFPIIAAIIIALAGGGTVGAAQAALPTDALYPVKLASEQALGALSFSDNAKVNNSIFTAERRLEEAQKLATKGTSDPKIQEAVAKTMSLFDQNIGQLDKKMSDMEHSGAAKDIKEAAKKLTDLEEKHNLLADIITAQNGGNLDKIVSENEVRLIGMEDKFGKYLFSDLNGSTSTNATIDNTAALYAQNKIAMVEGKLDEVVKTFNDNKAILTASQQSDIQSKIDEAKTKLAEAKNALATGNYLEAFNIANDVFSSTIDARTTLNDDESEDSSIEEDHLNNASSSEATYELKKHQEEQLREMNKDNAESSYEMIKKINEQNYEMNKAQQERMKESNEH